MNITYHNPYVMVYTKQKGKYRHKRNNYLQNRNFSTVNKCYENKAIRGFYMDWKLRKDFTDRKKIELLSEDWIGINQVKKRENNVPGPLARGSKKDAEKRPVWKEKIRNVHDESREVDEAGLWCKDFWDMV